MVQKQLDKLHKVEFSRHLFATLTYSRDRTLQDRWSTVSKDFNRFIQKFRRCHVFDCNYLRVIEKHRDGYPHIHCLLQYPSAILRVENTRYFDKTLYQKWKLQWEHGHSDFQKPRGHSVQVVSYVLKYLIKNQTNTTVWRKILDQQNSVVLSDAQMTLLSSPTSPTKPSDSSVTSTTQDKDVGEPFQEEVMPVRLNGIKLCTWSRKFDWSPFRVTKTK